MLTADNKITLDAFTGMLFQITLNDIAKYKNGELLEKDTTYPVVKKKTKIEKSDYNKYEYRDNGFIRTSNMFYLDNKTKDEQQTVSIADFVKTKHTLDTLNDADVYDLLKGFEYYLTKQIDVEKEDTIEHKYSDEIRLCEENEITDQSMLAKYIVKNEKEKIIQELQAQGLIIKENSLDALINLILQKRSMIMYEIHKVMTKQQPGIIVPHIALSKSESLADI